MNQFEEAVNELVEGLRGDYGQQAQQEAGEALAIVAEKVDFISESDQGGDKNSWDEAVIDQIQRYEDHLNKGIPRDHHRGLTEQEMQRIYNDAWKNQEIPDLVAQHEEGKGAADWGRTEEGRHQHGVEAVERALDGGNSVGADLSAAPAGGE